MILIILLKEFPPKKIYALLWEFIRQAGLDKKYFELKSPPTQFLENYRIAIYKTYKECERLVVLLDRLLNMNQITTI